MTKWSTPRLDLSSRTEVVEMNVLLIMLYLILSLPLKVPQYMLIWLGAKPRIKLQIHPIKTMEVWHYLI